MPDPGLLQAGAGGASCVAEVRKQMQQWGVIDREDGKKIRACAVRGRNPEALGCGEQCGRTAPDQIASLEKFRLVVIRA